MNIKRLSAISLFIVFIVSVLFITPSERAYACTCIPKESAVDSFARKDVVFAGKVVEISNANFLSAFSNVEVVVSRVWKGQVKEKIQVETALHSESCGYPFKEGESYLFYAAKEGGNYTTTICDRTSVLQSASADIQEFGNGYTPVTSKGLGGWVVGVTVLFLSAAIVWLWIRKKKRKKLS